MACETFQQSFSATALHSMHGSKRRKRNTPTGRKLSIIPEEVPSHLFEQNSKRSADASTSSNLDTLVASVFGSVDWDDGQDEVDLEILYRLQRPDLRPQTQGQPRPNAPVFNLVNWARQAAFEAQDALIEESYHNSTPDHSSPVDSVTSSTESEDEESNDSLASNLEALMIEVVKTVSITAMPLRPAPARPQTGFQLPLRLQTHSLHSPMMTPINSPLNSVSCF
ncbi:hypothetical protein K431DRAFT_282619 [Polychaeton citri CBS 116435]|uniref:Uncharacterized protein n=1 Tax=Polychaeton citri CBS 116435 TaxID=1314669 RepID=A0A9P4QCL1_9PEZI|nr:hypothetical protein K431DRAFT_282619 [Polychaeton citri CBS 116435]